MRRVSEGLSYFINRNHISIWNWVQKYHPKKISSRKRKIVEYIADETMLKVGPEYIWLWVKIDVKSKEILALSTSKERNMFVAERFISGLIKSHGRHPVSTDGGTWYPMTCKFLNIKHHLRFFGKEVKSLIKRKMQYIKYRTESFDDYFPCRKENCKLKHVLNWLNLYVTYHNKEMINA